MWCSAGVNFSAGQFFFSIYMLPLGLIVNACEINLHCYEDNTQIYIPLTGSNMNTFSHVMAGLSYIQY